jgi:PAS domain S-box-containing protein
MNISQADCRAIFDAMGDAILIYEVSTGEILEVNRGMCEMLGFTPEEARQLKVTALCGGSGSQLEPCLSLLAKAAAGNPQIFECQARDRAGRIFWVEVHLKPIRLGGRDCVLAVLRDIDRRKQAQNALKESEARYRAVTEGSLAGVYVIQDEGIVYVNSTLAQMFGYQPEEIMAGAVSPQDVVHPGDLPLVLENVRRRLSGELEAAHYTFRGLHRDGTVILCESFGRAVEYQGRPAIVGTLLDITERLRAEQELQDQKNLVNVVFSATPDLLLLKDRDLVYRAVNPAFCFMLGKSEEEIIGKTDLDLFPRLEAERYRSDDRRVMATGVSLVQDEYATGKGGARWFQVIKTPVNDEQGNPSGLICSVRDITDRKRAEEALQTQTQVLESMAEGVTVTDAGGKIIYSNPAFDTMFGFQPGELIGQSASRLNDFSAAEGLRFAQEMVEQLKTKRILSGEVRNRRKDGTPFYTQARISALEIAGKQCWVTVQEDITERRQVEEALRQSEASYRIVTEGSLAGVYVIQDGKFRYVNPMLAQAFGYTPDELIDHLDPSDLVDPEDRDRIAGVINRRLAGEGLPSRSYFRGLCKDGSVIYVETLSRRVEYQGRPAVMGTFLDVTERRLAEEALKASEEKYRTIFGAVNDSIIVIDPKTGALLEVNDKFLESGYQIEEIGHLNVQDLCSDNPPFTIHEAREWIRKTVEEGPQVYEWLSTDRYGRRSWIEINLSLTPLGGQDRILAVARDISERKQAEDIRRRAYEELEGLVAERTAGLQSANAQLRCEIEERQRNEAIIRLQRDLALTLSGKMGLQETLRLCVETAITISGLDSGGVYLVDSASGDLDLAYHQGISPEFVRQSAHYEADDINTYLVMAGKPLYARLEDLPGIMDEDGLKEGLRSVAIIPVVHQDQVIACINAASHQIEEVPATARAALETLAAQVGSVIARVQAEEDLRRAKEDLEIRVVERTAQLRQANESLEAELRVRRDMEKSLRYNEAKYRTLVEQIPAITYTISLAAGVDFLYVSPQVETLLGFSPEAWRTDAENWERQIHPDDRERLLAEITYSLETGEPFSTEYRLLAKSGRVVWFRDEARVVYDPEGQFLFLQGLALDITERKRAEDALRQTTQILQTLIQASPLAIIVLDLDFTIRLWNPGAERMFGWKESEVLGGCLPCVPPEQLIEEDARLKVEMAGKAQSALELKRARKDGSILDVHLWTASLLDANGRIIGNMGILADITARKRTEEALRASEANYRTIFNGVNDGIGVVDMATGNFLDVNRKWLEMTGFTVEEARGLNVGALCLPGAEFTPADAYQRVQAAVREGPQLFEWLAQTKYGQPHWVEVNLRRAVINGQDRLLTVVRDITARKQAEEKLRRQAELLDLAHDAIIVRDLDNRIVFWNSGAEETYGWAKSEMQGQEPHQILKTEFPQPRQDLEAELFRQGQWQGELSQTRRDGRRIIVTSRWALQRDKEGNPAAILEINRDITGQKQAEAGRARLAAILEATSDLVGSSDREGRVLYLNRAGRKMMGIGVDEDISRLTVKDLHPEWAYRLILEQGDIEAPDQQVWSGETAFRSRGGQEIPTSQVIIAHKDASGKVEFFSTIARDITASQQAAQALQEANNRLRTLVQASPLAIIALDLKGRVISWNPAAERMFGWSQDEVMGRALPTIPREQEQAFNALRQSNFQGTALLGQEVHRQRRDGSVIDVSLSTAPLHDGAGAVMGNMGIIEDITERKRMAATLRQASRALKAITECHQALIRATDETELLGEVCRIIVEVGGYRMAWVGYAEADASKSVRPVAQTGFDAGYVEQLHLTWADKERGRGPTGKAIRRGKPVICRDTQVDPGFAFMAEEARIRGYASVLALPLNDFHTFGALNIYATEPDAFDDKEINLLLGLANDLAYGIMALRGRAERRRAEAALKESEQELRRLASQLLSIQEKERRRVARELHDELGQALTVLKINLVAIEDQLAPDQQHLKANCEHMLSYIDTVIENVRRLSWDLSPSSLEDLGLSAALGYLVDETCRNHHMESAVVMDEIDNLFTPEIQINIYRIFQESLTNVVKHARASLVSVNVTRENGKVSFTIRDNGRGFNVKQAMSGKVAKKSLGLTAMNERALMARGSFQLSSRKGRGTTIEFSIPTAKRGK